MQVPLKLVLQAHGPEDEMEQEFRKARICLRKELMKSRDPSFRQAQDVGGKKGSPARDEAHSKHFFLVKETASARDAQAVPASSSQSGVGRSMTQESPKFRDDRGGVNARRNVRADYTVPYWALLRITEGDDSGTSSRDEHQDFERNSEVALVPEPVAASRGYTTRGTPLPPAPSPTIPLSMSSSALPSRKCSLRGGRRSKPDATPSHPHRPLLLQARIMLYHPEGSAVAARQDEEKKLIKKVRSVCSQMLL